MANYAANGPITVPLNVPALKPDVDLGGLKFSYEHGIFYSASVEPLPITLPPAWQGGRVWNG